MRAALTAGTAVVALMAASGSARAIDYYYYPRQAPAYYPYYPYYPNYRYQQPSSERVERPKPKEPAPERIERPKPKQAAQERVERPKRKQAAQAKREAPPKPLQVPLIAISIATQRLTLYDNGVPIAHAPVSTGMAGHPTPTGIFSVIQKERYHESNIYSGAPMPYMQRITWSGVAMHAGVLPGYPASHGCIRMPYDFAVKLYGLTRTGARVIITRSEVTPVEFEHGRLFVLNKPEPAKHAGDPKPAADAGIRNGWIRIAEGEAAMMSDAVAAVAQALAGIARQKPEAGAEPSEAVEPSANPVATVEPPVVASPATESPVAEVTAQPSKDTADTAAAEPVEGAPANPVATVEPSPATEPPVAEVAAESPKDMADTAAAGPIESAPVNAAMTVEPPKESANETATKEPESPIGTVLVTPVPVAAPHTIEIPKTFEATTEPPKAAPAPVPATALEPYGPPRPLRPGPITVFVSKKEGKVFVRKAFQPVFDAPVTIARPDSPLGTHLFTAVQAKPDGASFRWLAISIPAEAPRKAEIAKTNKHSKPSNTPPMADMVPQTAAQALERIEMPPEAVAQISALMSAGASLIISDQGLGPETGRETDFIVLTR